jgi:hypothetical protein
MNRDAIGEVIGACAVVTSLAGGNERKLTFSWPSFVPG